MDSLYSLPKYLLEGLAALILSVAALFSGACSRSDKDADSLTPAARQHAQWRASLADSVTKYEQLQADIQAQLDSLLPRTASLADEFDAITDPVLVEKYRVPRGWKNYDTTSGTGILARVLEDNSVEIIATCAAGPFQAVTLSSGTASFTSKSIPVDGEINQNINGTGRLAINGHEATAIARMAASSENTLTLSYISASGKPLAKITLSQKQKQMLSDVARLHSSQQLMDSLNRAYTIAFNKMQLYLSETEKDAKPSGTTENQPKNISE